MLDLPDLSFTCLPSEHESFFGPSKHCRHTNSSKNMTEETPASTMVFEVLATVIGIVGIGVALLQLRRGRRVYRIYELA